MRDEDEDDTLDVAIELDDLDADIEVEDDTPEEDRNRTPLPKEIVEELEADELDDYSEKVKVRLKQLKKVWHDERREKERAAREQQEAIALAQRVLEENKRLKATLSQGEETLVSSYKSAVELELASARREYKEAYEAGDTDRVLEAQEKLNDASYRLQQLKSYKPTLQADELELPVSQQVQSSVNAPNAQTLAWQERNTWFGSDEEMTASALGLHQKLIKQYGAQYAGTDEYWKAIDNTMRRRFPEYFGEDVKPASGSAKTAARDNKRAPVVTPATRSTSAKKIVLKQSQLAIAKKLGLTPEQYAREALKMDR